MFLLLLLSATSLRVAVGQNAPPSDDSFVAMRDDLNRHNLELDRLHVKLMESLEPALQAASDAGQLRLAVYTRDLISQASEAGPFVVLDPGMKSSIITDRRLKKKRDKTAAVILALVDAILTENGTTTMELVSSYETGLARLHQEFNTQPKERVVDETKKGRLDQAMAIQGFQRKLEHEGPFLFVLKSEESEWPSDVLAGPGEAGLKNAKTTARDAKGKCPCFDCATVEYLRGSQWKLRGSSWLMTFGPDRKTSKSWGIHNPHWLMDNGELVFEESRGVFNDNLTVLTVQFEGTQQIWNLVMLPYGRTAPGR